MFLYTSSLKLPGSNRFVAFLKYVQDTCLPCAERTKGANSTAVITLRAATARMQENVAELEAGSGKQVGTKLGNFAALQAIVSPCKEPAEKEGKGPFGHNNKKITSPNINN